MWLYVENILLSIILFSVVDITHLKKKFKLFYISAIILVILLSSSIAGFRADTVGTDMKVYVEPLQKLANMSTNYLDFVNNNLFPDVEKGYLTLVFLISRFTSKLWVNNFIVELIILIFLISGLLKFKKNQGNNDYLFLGITIFYCFFYNLSFNMVRQSIAIFILFYTFNFLIEKKYIKYIIGTILAIFFHQSAIISIPIALIFLLTSDNKENLILSFGKNTLMFKAVTIRSIIILMICALFMLMPNLIISVMRVLRLTNYISGYASGFSIDPSLTNILPRILFIIVLALEWRQMSLKDNKLRYFYIVMALIDFGIFQFSGYAYRIGWYTSMFYIYSIPDALSDDSNKLRKNVLVIFLIVALIIYWYLYFVVANLNETVPYVFGGFN